MLARKVEFIAILLAFVAACASGAAAQQTPAAPSRWPLHAQTADGAQVTIFQPQLESFQGDALSGRAAVAVTVGQQEPVFGAVWLQSRVATDRVARTVQILDVNVTQVRFPGASPVAEPNLAAAVKQAILAQPITLPLDHLLASLEVIHKAQSAAANLQNAPPIIIFRDHPTVEVQFDGTPQWAAETDTGLMRAVNTPFFVALDPTTRTYFLKGAGQWFTAPAPLGPFQYTKDVPRMIAAAADESGYSDPQTPIPAAQATMVEIMTATDPTELIWTDGPPQTAPIPGTALLYWTNTDSDVFLLPTAQQTFVLLSGRWYAAGSINGPWTYVAPNQLPPDFAKIPPNSPKANILADVAGTQAAQDAVADTYIPQTAAIDVHQFDQPPVSYDGDPDFEPIESTDMSYAVNTDASVVMVNENYYCCYNGVWYMSDSPTGPWAICEEVPPAIYTIPPSCPIYPVQYCNVYGYTPDVVYCGYTPGYVGCYPCDGVVVYGTGWRYKSWFRDRYIPRPGTFGFGAHYHAYTGHWGFGFGSALGGGGLWIADTQRYTGRGGAWFGYGGFRPSMVRSTQINRAIVDANNSNIQAAKQPDPYGRNVYERRSDLHTELAGVTRRDAITNPPGRTSPTQMPPAAARNDDLEHNNVYADPNGNIYRRTDNGWETREGNDWKPTNSEPQRTAPVENRGNENPPVIERGQEPPAQSPHEVEHREQPAAEPSNPGDLNDDYRARTEGDQRAQAEQPPQEREQPQQAPQEQHEAPAGGGGGDRGGGGGGGGGDRGGGGGGGRR